MKEGDSVRVHNPIDTSAPRHPTAHQHHSNTHSKKNKKNPFNKKYVFALFTIIILSTALAAVFKYTSQSHSFDTERELDAQDTASLFFSDNEDADRRTDRGADGRGYDDTEQSPVQAENADAEMVREVLLDEVRKQDITFTDREVDKYIQESLDAYDMEEEELLQHLDQAGITYDQYKEVVQSQLAISELVNEHVDLESVDVSNEEVDTFIQENNDAFSDFFDDEESFGILKERVRFKLLADKQTELVMEYVNSVQ